MLGSPGNGASGWWSYISSYPLPSGRKRRTTAVSSAAGLDSPNDPASLGQRRSILSTLEGRFPEPDPTS